MKEKELVSKILKASSIISNKSIRGNADCIVGIPSIGRSYLQKMWNIQQINKVREDRNKKIDNLLNE